MKICSIPNVARIALLMTLALGLPAVCAELKVFCVPALRPVVNEIRPQFEQSTGHTLLVKFEFVPAVVRQIEAGEKFDLAIVEPAAIDQLINEGKVIRDSRANVAYVGLGLGVREGSAKPDIGSVAAFKRTLLNAKSIAYQPDTGSGKYFLELLERLGIAADMKNKLIAKAGGDAVPSVAKGEAELVVISIPGILATPGVVLAGALPMELQSYIQFAGGVGTQAKEPDAAKAFLKFLTSNDIVPLLKAKGLEPGKP